MGWKSQCNNFTTRPGKFLQCSCNDILHLAVGVAMGKLLKVDKSVTLLISTGASICGVSAVMAAAPVVEEEGASGSKVSIALATVMIFGIASMFLYPIMSTRMPWAALSAKVMGIYTGATVYEVAGVVAAGNAMSPSSCLRSVVNKTGSCPPVGSIPPCLKQDLSCFGKQFSRSNTLVCLCILWCLPCIILCQNSPGGKWTLELVKHMVHSYGNGRSRTREWYQVYPEDGLETYALGHSSVSLFSTRRFGLCERHFASAPCITQMCTSGLELKVIRLPNQRLFGAIKLAQKSDFKKSIGPRTGEADTGAMCSSTKLILTQNHSKWCKNNADTRGFRHPNIL